MIKIEAEDTFVRPCYAGNAISVVKSRDKIKLVTVRPTNFDAAESGGKAVVENVDVSAWLSGLNTKFVEN